ncbi:hypothetical protein JR316_0009609 [Psilocybe cubensis]|uniref:Uncharacterized protein n=2 Tax=Psilocybe cubensis TaxID=181762 RepID=A0ACB8GP03_PSICU|nr:hypothetical protein JR316_0009609 [Psilocybe cubensis]KAH9477396.1 hypothetical protein JR316_0009609 [Psilocybe cubensis]
MRGMQNDIQKENQIRQGKSFCRTVILLVIDSTLHYVQHNEEDTRHATIVALKNQGTLTCRECKSDFRFYFSLADHILATKHNHDLDPAIVPATTNTKVSTKGNQSIANRPRDMKCVFCTDLFKSPSGISQHIEAGVHEFHRHHVTAAIKSMGVVPQITIQDYTNSATPPPVPAITTYVATAAAFNGSAYACFLCEATFKSLPALNSHLNSAAHDAAEFKCPNVKCGREFTLISGLIQHLESKCCGLAPLVEIDGYFEKLEEQFSRTMETRQIRSTV